MATIPADVQSEDSGSEEDAAEYSREELLSSNPFTLANFSKRKIRYMALFDVEHWAAELKGFTFLTTTAEVDWAEAEAVQHFYQEGICKQRNKITVEDEQALGRLRCKIDALISDLRASSSRDDGFFVRLGPRSPKDAPMLASDAGPQSGRAASLCGIPESKLRAALQEAADAHAREGGDGNVDACGVLQIFQGICYRFLRVTSGEEALRLLVSSSRVMQDISHTLDQGASGWSMSVVAREWDQEVRLEREFRTFVVAGEITAISQYDDQLMYPFVAAHAEQIVAAISQCVAVTKPQLQRLSANLGVVVDCLVVPGDNGSAWQARIIELNPFGPMTGASLFYWTGDRRLLQGGQDVYGDLGECELRTPAGSIAPPPHVHDLTVSGVPFRYVAQNPPGFDWEQLQAYWEDYYRLAPPELQQKRI